MDDVLVLVRDCEAWQPHVRYAASLAAQLNGSINGMFVLPPAIPMPANASAAFAQEIVEIYREEEARALRAGESFARWAATKGVKRSTWCVAQGVPAEALEAAANWHDLVVLKAHNEPFGDGVLETGSAIVRAGLPCIVVPSGIDRARLDTIAIAWNGSLRSARAAHAALSLLPRAKRVAILRVGNANRAEDESRIGLDDFLRWHRLRCERIDLDADKRNAGAALLDGAMRISADLLVLGAYGHGRFSEWVFSGVTRHVLQHVALPLFMRH